MEGDGKMKSVDVECGKCGQLAFLPCDSAIICIRSNCAGTMRPLISKTEPVADVLCSDGLSDMPMTLGDMVERAAKHLPEGYIIDIQVEKDGYGVGLITENGRLDLDGGDGMISDINEGISVANGFGR
jgi:hypothetical protein